MPRWAPPLTRGSTLAGPLSVLAGGGSPAHAGIDPASTGFSCPPSWLPRSRGDRPPDGAAHPARRGAPPLTRGSTRRYLQRRRFRRGSPAHAGIDPISDQHGSLDRRLPRSRGDRPSPAGLSCGRMAAPPLTRGSTRDAVEPRAGGQGSPAHAGIDRTRRTRKPFRRRLPRSRGDRPYTATRHFHFVSAPPLTRGSTRLLRRRDIIELGSPAHAGIDPSLPQCEPRHVWLPRSRGDRPG